MNPQPALSGALVDLLPLQREHEAALVAAAADGQLWNSRFTVVPTAQTVGTYVGTALAGREAGTVMPFVIALKQGNRIVGTTRFWKIDRTHRKMEIGHTWLAASTQRTGVNTEAKLLLLTHAFEEMNAVRVQFTTDELNQASRAAIVRIGATMEGIVRHERIMPDGRKRNSVRYSIIDDEWPRVRAHLQAMLARA